jgi:four helix bundle protein
MDFEVELKRRTRQFAVAVIRFAESLPRDRSTDIMVRQMIRSATSVGANYRAACKARSKADFISKIAIAEEEADETQYWLEILSGLELISDAEFRRLHGEASQLTAILTSSGRTAKLNP